MKTKFIIITLLFIIQLNAQIIKSITINFEKASYKVSKEDETKINSILNSLTEEKAKYNFQIIGHTDNNGDLNYNYTLSNDRANSVATFIKKNGFLEANIYTGAKSFLKPIAQNKTEIGKAKNRRVTIVISIKKESEIRFSGLKLKENNFIVDTKNPEKIEYKSGTKIIIPQDAFVDKNGTPITGNIDLKYIEYREPIDYILGNIPMDYNDGKENYHFNSAGMFKITATKNGDEVFLKNGKTINLDFKITDELPNLNFYELQNKKWIELKKLNPANTNNLIDSNSDDVYNYRDSIVLCNFDKCSLLYALKKTGIKNAISNNSIYKNYKKNDEINSKTVYDLNLKAQKDSIIQYQKRDSLFEIQNKDKFKRINLKIDLFTKRIAQNKVQLDNTNSKINELVLKNNSFKLSNDSIRQSKLINNLNLRKIGIISRNDKFQSKINELINSKGTKPNLPEFPKYYKSNANNIYYECFWEANKNYMSKEEISMDIENWLQYFDANKKEMLVRYSNLTQTKECIEIEANRRIEEQKNQKIAQENYDKIKKEREIISQAQNVANELTKSLSINNLGIYNCDQIQRLENPVEIFAEYQDKNGNEINPLFIYLLDSKFNGIIKYDGYNSYSPFRFAYSPTSKNTLLAFDGNGNSYIYESDKFNEINAPKKYLKHKFVLKKINNLNDTQDLKDLL